MRVKGLCSTCIHLLLVHSQQIKGDIITVALYCNLKELDLELRLSLVHKLKRETESSAENEDLNYLFLDDVLVVVLQKLFNIVVAKMDF